MPDLVPKISALAPCAGSSGVTNPTCHRCRPLRVLSLGAGVQSTTVALMSTVDELERLDCCIFADTGWEPSAVYQHLEWLIAELAKYNLPVHRVAAGNIKADALVSQLRSRKAEGQRWMSMPLFTLGPNGEPGMIKRQCTKEYKVEPIERFIRRELLGMQPGQRAPEKAVELWFGISSDEAGRARLVTDHWKTHRYPLLENRITRHLCLEWLKAHGYPEPPRSACVGCPFKHDREWLWLKTYYPKEFADAVEFDKAIRNCGGMRGQMFLHRSCKPLGEVVLDGENGQLSLWQDECQGYCGN